MGIPTGTGSEVLYSGSIEAQSNTGTSFRWDKTNPTLGTSTYVVPANHLITLLNVIFCEVAGNAAQVYLWLYNGSSTINILREQDLPAKGTFVFNDKIIAVPGNKIIVETAGTADVDVTYNFIDQNWED
jgi:hypothetical protein|tara:strand:+ start:42 stop:428 length:387 start_codon:yes stop_codon:yes gene_type:complete